MDTSQVREAAYVRVGDAIAVAPTTAMALAFLRQIASQSCHSEREFNLWAAFMLSPAQQIDADIVDAAMTPFSGDTVALWPSNETKRTEKF